MILKTIILVILVFMGADSMFEYLSTDKETGTFFVPLSIRLMGTASITIVVVLLSLGLI